MDWSIVFKIGDIMKKRKLMTDKELIELARRSRGTRGTKGKCTVCKKVFIAKKGESLIGKLGIIPVDLCKTHLKKVLSYDEMNLNDTRV